ncbi:hypothetical protein BDZ45DRAFT_718337 [Acephala macrosclerotiorum]|nr:hypothetical protein BDZ45DRAFT_718337 [Acephala macrosclerotiorum]
MLRGKGGTALSIFQRAKEEGVLSTNGHVTSGRDGHGSIGYGINMYDLECAALNCSMWPDNMTTSGMTLNMMEMDMSDFSASPACYASDDIFLQSLVQSTPKLTYQQALARVTITPNVTIVSGDPLNQTSLFNALLIDPPLFGKHHVVLIIFGLVQAPTCCQGLFTAYLLLLNFLLCATIIAVNYHSLEPNSWYPNGGHDEVLTYVTNRMGVLSFANLPLLFLYAGRNNVLLYITNWLHSTFILLHRWIAYIATFEACLHSAVWLQNYITLKAYSTGSRLVYWYWGIIATLAMSLLVPLSILPIRRKLYEVFLVWDVALSAIVVTWITITIGVRAFDRVMRFLRIVRNGICTAEITPIDDDYLRVEIEAWENHPFLVAATLLPYTEDAPSLDAEAHPSADSEGAQRADREGVDKEVFIGTRMVVREILEDVVSKSGDGVVVVVSGPLELADEVRVTVSEAGRKGERKNIKLVEESFSW